MLCCGTVNRLIGGLGVNWCNSRFSEYVDSVAPAQLYVDCYKLMGRTYPSQGPNPPPGVLNARRLTAVMPLQQQLDAECQELDAAREAANGTIPIWCTVQAFGEYLSTDNTLRYKSEWNTLSGPGAEPRGDEGISREPTAREFRCMSWLALACGAKGLDCMQLVPMAGHWYSTEGTKDYWLIGLMGYDSAETVPRGHRALFDTVRALNSTLAKIAPTLLNLTAMM